jgi:hypothetical protein
VLTAAHFCQLFPDEVHLEQFIASAKVLLDFGERKPFAAVVSCWEQCTRQMW